MEFLRFVYECLTCFILFVFEFVLFLMIVYDFVMVSHDLFVGFLPGFPMIVYDVRWVLGVFVFKKQSTPVYAHTMQKSTKHL